ncbi:MAG: cytochrome b5-like heme/steroid binding domain-containing protein [Candidatus Nanopelagicales bacterium]
MLTHSLSVTGSVRFESAETGGILDLVDGIPVHPLIVHLAVVAVPVAALGLILMAASRRFSRKYGWLVALASIAAAGVTVLAREAGEALRARVGEPGFNHAELGDLMPIFAGALVLATVGLWLVDRTGPADQTSRRGLRTAAVVVAILVAAANLIWVFRVGHSGAKSVWAGAVATEPAAEPSPSASPSGTAPPSAAAAPTASAPASEPGTPPATATQTGGPTTAVPVYSLAQLAAHDTAADCWVAVNAKVYDLSTWVNLHPGGAQRIIDLCGTDATAAFQGQHGSQSQPNVALTYYDIGTLS